MHHALFAHLRTLKHSGIMLHCMITTQHVMAACISASPSCCRCCLAMAHPTWENAEHIWLAAHLLHPPVHFAADKMRGRHAG